MREKTRITMGWLIAGGMLLLGLFAFFVSESAGLMFFIIGVIATIEEIVAYRKLKRKSQ